MKRRVFAGTIALGLLAISLTVDAQPAAKVHRVGFIGNSTAGLESNLVTPMREGFRELGYVEGRLASVAVLMNPANPFHAMVVSLKAAEVLGLTIPKSLLVRADQLIE